MKENNGERWTIKQTEAQKKKPEEQIEELTEESRKDDLITFEEIGIDTIMVDEAHGFKNLAIFSKMNSVAGISSSGAKKSTDMQLKCQYIIELNGGRGIVFATGTPSAIPCVSCMSCSCIFRRKHLTCLMIGVPILGLADYIPLLLCDCLWYHIREVFIYIGKFGGAICLSHQIKN